MKKEETIKEIEKRFDKKMDDLSVRNWIGISSAFPLTEDFIREYQDKLNWVRVSEVSKMSESFITEFEDKVNWSVLSLYQTFSYPFILENLDKINLVRALENPSLELSSDERETLLKMVQLKNLYKQ